MDSSHNNIFGNNITENTSVGIWLGYSYDNRFWHNNIINTRQLFIHPLHSNVWDDGYPSGGNYWSNYKGVDFYSGQFQNETGSDGVGDTPHVVFGNENNTDRYPLIAPITILYAGTWNEVSYKIDIISNSTISDFHFKPEEGAFLRFNVNGDDGTVDFCRVTIPKSLLWAENGWNITVGDQPIKNYLKFEDENSTYLYFTYTHSTKTVTIQVTHVILELPSIAITPLLIVIPILAVIVKKKTARKLNT